MKGRTRLHVLFWTDAAALVNLALLAATGFLIEYVLPPGTGGGWLTSGGRGVGRGETVKTVLGYTRHQWGHLHYILALVFLGLMLVHLALHANWIKCYLRRSRAVGAACPPEESDGESETA